MLTVTIASQKGGVGKTTLACCLVVAGEQAGLDTVLIDLDPQSSASRWSDLRESDTPVITSAHATRLEPVLKAAREQGAELVVIDTAPHVADAALTAARAANLVVIPCRPSAADLDAIGATIDIARIAGRAPVAVLNAAPVRNPLVDEAREAIEAYGVECAPVVVHQRIDHVHAWTSGLAAVEYAPGGKAASETTELYAWIRTRGGESGKT